MNFEQTILAHLIENEQYSRKVIPFLDAEYFHDSSEQTIFNLINNYFIKYNQTPTTEALITDLGNLTTLDQSQLDTATNIIKCFESDDQTALEWLVDRTEQFCQEKAIHNALFKSINIVDGKNKKADKNAIPKILTDALAISFDTNVGHDFVEDSDIRYEYYHRQEHKIPFDIEWLNTITKGGVEKKTLNLIMAGTGVGKTLTLCHLSASYLAMGLNVLYVTLEISDMKIAERIDANLLNISLDDLQIIGKDMYTSKIDKMKSKITSGKLIIKEFPATSMSIMHLRHLLDELKVKKNFVPDVVFVDSLNLMLSSRYKANQVADLYQHGKNVAEEVRGLAVEKNLPIWSAIQLNRVGFESSNPGLAQTGESFAIPQTTDLLLILTTSEQLAEMFQLLITQGKNRYRDESINRKFIVGVDKNKMRLYNTESSSQDDIIDNKKEQVIIKDKRGKNLEKMFKGIENG